MDAAARWLVCAGQGALLPIVAAVVSAGFEGGVDWEPSLAKACTKAALACASEGANVIVGPTGEEDALSAACRLAQVGGGVVVLCVEGARDLACEAAAHGVTAAVEPPALGRLLMALGASARRKAGAAGAGRSAPEPGREAPEPARPAPEIARPAPEAAREAAASRLPWRDAQDGRAAQGRPATGGLGAPAEAASPAVTGGLRPAGCLPRTGVVEELQAVRARQAQAVAEAAPAGRRGAPESPGQRPASAREALRELDIDTEPVVMRPVVELRQTDAAPSCPPAPCAPASGLSGDGFSDDGFSDGRAHVPTVCFASARGGVGKSSLAVLASISLAREGLRVALIDLDYQFGTCLGYLGAAETYGLLDGACAPGSLRIDEQALARCRSVPEGGLFAYEFCNAPEQAELLAQASARLVRVASAGADIAIVDLPPGVGEAAAQVFELADRCLLVTDQRAFSLESLATQQGLCVRMGIARTKLVTVINRCDPRHRDEGFLSRAQFEVQTPQSMRVVDGGPEVAQMLGIGSAGELVGMRNRFALSAADMAHAICSDLGCRPRAASGPAPAQLAAAPLVREGRFGKRRRDRRGELAPCPF